jgi:uncharacterized membrane protein
MTNLDLIPFDEVKGAGKVRETLCRIEKQGLLNLDDSAIVVKDWESDHER